MSHQGPDPYGSGASAGWHAPPGQGYDPNSTPYGQDYHSPPQHNAYDQDGFPIPPGHSAPHQPAASAYDPHNFAPPPRQDYPDDEYSQAPQQHEYEHGYGREREYDHQAGGGYDDRPYAPSEAYGHEGNAIEPYDEAKAQAGEQREWEEEQERRREQQAQQNAWQHAQAPPPMEHDPGRERRYDDRARDDEYYDYRPRRNDRDRRSYDDERDRYSDSRRRDSRNQGKRSKTDIFGGKEGEKGLGAKILGGAVGGFAGHELGGSLLDTLGGAVVGAFGATMLENEHEKRKTKKENDIKNHAPFKDEAMSGGRRGSQYGGGSSLSRAPTRDDRRDYDSRRSRSRSTRRRGSPGRRGYESDEYSSDDSRPYQRRESRPARNY